MKRKRERVLKDSEIIEYLQSLEDDSESEWSEPEDSNDEELQRSFRNKSHVQNESSLQDDSNVQNESSLQDENSVQNDECENYEFKNQNVIVQNNDRNDTLVFENLSPMKVVEPQNRDESNYQSFTEHYVLGNVSPRESIEQNNDFHVVSMMDDISLSPVNGSGSFSSMASAFHPIEPAEQHFQLKPLQCPTPKKQTRSEQSQSIRCPQQPLTMECFTPEKLVSTQQFHQIQSLSSSAQPQSIRSPQPSTSGYLQPIQSPPPASSSCLQPVQSPIPNKRGQKRKLEQKNQPAKKLAQKKQPVLKKKPTKQPERVWFRIPKDVKRMRLKLFDYDDVYGPVWEHIPDNATSPLDFYSCFLTEELLEMIVKETNCYAEQQIIHKITNETMNKNSRMADWREVTLNEMRTFFAIVLWMGLNPRPSIRSYWSRSIIYQSLIGNYMSRNRFELILSNLHFTDNENADCDDRLYKISPLILYLNDRFMKLYKPGGDLCIDETMMPWRGRLLFRQYIPNKRHKYGVKFYKLCLPHGYTHRFKIYCGTSESTDDSLLSSEAVVMDLCGSLLNVGRTLYTDNYYTSVNLADKLLQKKTHLVGTLRSNRKHNPHSVLTKKLEKGEMTARVSQCVSVCKWKDKRDVLFLTTKHRPGFQVTKNKQKIIMKPTAIVAYNKAKTYIDVSDQVKTYGTATRRGIKWYRKVAIELLCNTAVVNAYILYLICVGKKMTVTEFREQLCVGLLSVDYDTLDSGCNTPSGSRSSTPRAVTPNSRSSTPRHTTPNSRTPTPTACLSTRFLSCAPKHEFVDTTPSRGRCVSCYANVASRSGRTVAMKLSFIHTKCIGCFQKFMCLNCYNKSHAAKVKRV